MRRPKWLELALIIVIIPLGAWAWRTGQRRAELEAAYTRLDRTVGDLDVVDPSKVFLRAIPTGIPLQYTWRMFLPSNRMVNVWSCGGGNTITGSAGGQFLFRLSLRDDGAEGFLVYIGEGPGWKMTNTAGDGALTDLLRGRWDRIIVEQTARTELIVADPAKPLSLLRLRLPDDLQAERVARLPAGAPVPDATFYELKIAP